LSQHAQSFECALFLLSVIPIVRSAPNRRQGALFDIRTTLHRPHGRTGGVGYRRALNGPCFWFGSDSPLDARHAPQRRDRGLRHPSPGGVRIIC
jgi:hypothetical protein